MAVIRSRGRLPHLEASGGIYFVTFRLADALPKKVVEAFEFERRDILATAKAMHRDLSASEIRRLSVLFSTKIDSYLDAGSGAGFLSVAAIAEFVAEALRHFHAVRYRLLAWCVMPNHVHVVLQPLGKWALSEILHTWKSYSAKQANRLLGRTGTFWQREYYDHLVRDEADLDRCVRYVLQNPRKAGLHDWPWVGTATP